ncbi:hypothetical protein [Andreprevotia chitinilytica]|uniref:hypothetical protein n=1 Tax=Andreprevotia chitinilytica TaxID=396808 RepID=UPI0005532D19|nr:hypothetical protein [Andreprevotia chitinilytica]
MADQDSINCTTHGDSVTTYVCQHLIRGENQDWYCAEPDEEKPWPDSWCGKCHEHFAKEGEWNDVSEQAADITNNVSILCNHCYEQIRSTCHVHYI